MCDKMNPNTQRAKILIEALPYIQKYSNKVVVIKYGGNVMTSEALKQEVMRDIVLLSLVGIKVVLVHGGGPEITATLDKMGIKTRFVNGLRYTDQETAGVVQMVLAGKVNKDLVALLGQHKGKALGLCGMDAGVIKARKMQGEEDMGFVGQVQSVNVKPIVDMLSLGYIPVVATVGCDAEGQVYNINADTCAAHIAAQLGAENLILMTDVRGILRDKEDESTLIEEVNVSNVPYLVKEGIITGVMIPKVECCVEAVRRGVKKAVIIDGRIEHAILIEMLSDKGIGTMFY